MIPTTVLLGSHLQLLVELKHITPRIWRRLVVPADLPLDFLHDVIQIAMGWKNSHLHDFTAGPVRFGMADVEDELLCVDERAAPVGAVAHLGSTFLYTYDYGDDWEHEVLVEAVIEPERGPIRLECLGGARACPPEDCGGPPGYEDLLRVLASPDDEAHVQMKRWVGRAYDQEAFDLAKVNKKLGVMAKRLNKAAGTRRPRHP